MTGRNAIAAGRAQGSSGLESQKMPNIIEFPHAASRVSHSAPTGNPPAQARSICSVVGALSRTLDQIRMLCEMIPDGPMRERLETEQARLTVGLFTARQTAALLASADASTPAADASDRIAPRH